MVLTIKILFFDMAFSRTSLFCCLMILITGCNILKKNNGIVLENGLYKPISSEIIQKVYVVFEDSVIRLYTLRKNGIAETSAVRVFNFNETRETVISMRLRKTSVDVDIFTIPFKYRPSVAGLPNQLNTNFSGAFYMGYRTDGYRFDYTKNPLQFYQKRLNHFGYSIGVFSGFGSTAMNPWVTQNGITSEYDGLVFSNGIAGIVAVSNLTFGLGVGVDHLLDKNKVVWIYQGKPWVGLTLGLNLN